MKNVRTSTLIYWFIILSLLILLVIEEHPRDYEREFDAAFECGKLSEQVQIIREWQENIKKEAAKHGWIIE